MKAIGYIRVSTSEQATDGLSLGNQAEKIRAYCFAKGWELVDMIEDAGESAVSLNRPGMAPQTAPPTMAASRAAHQGNCQTIPV